MSKRERTKNKGQNKQSDGYQDRAREWGEIVFTILLRPSNTMYIEMGTNCTEKKEYNIANKKK